MTKDGISATKKLSEEGVPINVTLVFSPQQALLAALAGATYVSPFIGRLDDIGEDGVGLVHDVAQLFLIHDFNTQIIAASIRHPRHVFEVATAGAHVITLPFKVLEQMFNHPLTNIGIKKFLEDGRYILRTMETNALEDKATQSTKINGRGRTRSGYHSSTPQVYFRDLMKAAIQELRQMRRKSPFPQLQHLGAKMI